MTLEIEGVRPAVLSQPTCESLGRLPRFRHVVRNLCAWRLRRADIDALIDELAEAHASLDAELRTFTDFLASL